MTFTRKTKIVATLGPASNSESMIEKLVTAGANVFRMNFSHGSHEDHASVHRAIRTVEARTGIMVAILADLQGPKLRIGVVPGGPRDLTIGDRVRLVLSNNGDGDDIVMPHPEIFETVKEGHLILIDDGRIRLRAHHVTATLISADVLNNATLQDRKGVNFPDTTLKVEPITVKDRKDLDFALKLEVDWIAMSFVQSAKDIQDLRALINGPTKIVAKIEKPIAVKNIDEILTDADAIMVARGDLGVECDWHELPAIQRNLVHKARAAEKPVIVATQMLESMIFAPIPTRAEASDVANAVSQRADAVMLSAESALGEYPVESVAAMVAISSATEKASMKEPENGDIAAFRNQDDSGAIASAAGLLAMLRNACCIATYTETGATAVRVSRARCDVPILAVCPNLMTARPLSLVWGVTPLVSTNIKEFASARKGRIPPKLGSHDLISTNKPVVVTSGSKHGQTGGTDSVRIAYLSE